MSVLDTLNPKQKAREFQSMQKIFRGKDINGRLAALPKLLDLRYFTEGNCLPRFLDSLSPNKVGLIRYCIAYPLKFPNNTIRRK